MSEGESMDYISNIQWYTDDCGDYWLADLYIKTASGGFKLAGKTGSYYCIDDKEHRQSGREQELDIEKEFARMEVAQ